MSKDAKSMVKNVVEYLCNPYSIDVWLCVCCAWVRIYLSLCTAALNVFDKYIQHIIAQSLFAAVHDNVLSWKENILLEIGIALGQLFWTISMHWCTWGCSHSAIYEFSFDLHELQYHMENYCTALLSCCVLSVLCMCGCQFYYLFLFLDYSFFCLNLHVRRQ